LSGHPVLIVDDDSTFRRLATRILKAAGVRVVGQADSVAARCAGSSRTQVEAAGLTPPPSSSGVDSVGVEVAPPPGPR
jgi:DNA-binding NtrC family response regulator